MDLDAELVADLKTAPFRDARYAPRRLEVEHRDDGSILLFNPTPYETANTATTLQPLDRWSAEAPDRVWLADRDGEGWRTVSYGQGAQQVAALAGGLAALGLGPGRNLLILARNGVDHALIAYGAMSLGCPIAPVSPQYGLAGADLTRLAHACQVLKPAAVYVDDAADFAEALRSEILAGLPVIASLNPRPGDVAFADLLAAAPAPASALPTDTAKLLLTSGSTGLPKAVILRHQEVGANAAQITACFDDPEPPVVVSGAPWSHSLGANAILHMVLYRGGTLYIDAGQPTPSRFAETVRNLKEVAPTYHNMVPAGWALLAGELERDPGLAANFFSRLRVMQYGGAGMPQSVCDRIQAVAVRTIGEKVTFASGFGATETGPTAANTHWLNERTGLCGLPTPQTRVKLAPEGEKYEFRVKGPQISTGYLGLPEVSAAAFDEEGYYRLGDAVKLADPARPEEGLIFDGRLVENFKLTSGTFVAAGALRLTALSAIGGVASDAIVCGEAQEGVGLMLFLDPKQTLAIGGPEAAREAIRAGLTRMNAASKGGGGKVARALILDGLPDPASGEITDKGYINQAMARARRPDQMARLFAADPDPGVLVF
jgi:feruloyl-CoA synthase